MKMISILFLCLISISSHAVSLSNSWVDKDGFKKQVTFSCSELDNECRNFCGNSKTCSYYEKPCRNCLGTNLKMSYIFTEMGRAYRNDGVSYRWDNIYDLVRRGGFVSLNAKSIYNHITRFNSLSMKRRFSALCEGAGSRVQPTVIFTTNEIGEVDQPKYVACGNKVYGLVHDPLILLNQPLD